MRKITLFIVALAVTTNFYSQEIVFEDSFESYTEFAIENIGSWTLLDEDGLTTYGFTGVSFPESGVAKSFQIFNSNSTTPPLEPSETADWSARTGVNSIVCFAAIPDDGNFNNDWLISPQINLGTGGSQLSFWYKATDGSFSEEEFTVGVSTTGTSPSDFTTISANPEVITNGGLVYLEFTADLTSFEGTPIYIGINCISNDQFGFMIDDFVVTSATLSNDNFVAETNFTQFVNNDKLHIQASAEFNEIEVFDLSGKQLFNQDLNGASNAQVDIEALNQGIYIAKVNSARGSHSFKFAK